MILLSKPMFHAYVFVSDNPVGKVFFEVGSFSQDICLCKAGEARESSIENVVDLVNQILFFKRLRSSVKDACACGNP